MDTTTWLVKATMESEDMSTKNGMTNELPLFKGKANCSAILMPIIEELMTPDGKVDRDKVMHNARVKMQEYPLSRRVKIKPGLVYEVTARVKKKRGLLGAKKEGYNSVPLKTVGRVVGQLENTPTPLDHPPEEQLESKDVVNGPTKAEGNYFCKQDLVLGKEFLAHMGNDLVLCKELLDVVAATRG